MQKRTLINIVGSILIALGYPLGCLVLNDNARKESSLTVPYPGDFHGEIEDKKVYLRRDSDYTFLAIQNMNQQVWHYTSYTDEGNDGSLDRFSHDFHENPYDENKRLKTETINVFNEIREKKPNSKVRGNTAKKLMDNDQTEYNNWLIKISKLKTK